MINWLILSLVSYACISIAIRLLYLLYFEEISSNNISNIISLFNKHFSHNIRFIRIIPFPILKLQFIELSNSKRVLSELLRLPNFLLLSHTFYILYFYLYIYVYIFEFNNRSHKQSLFLAVYLRTNERKEGTWKAWVGRAPSKKQPTAFSRADKIVIVITISITVAGDFGPRALFPTRPRSPDRSHQRVQFAPANLDFHASSSR